MNNLFFILNGILFFLLSLFLFVKFFKIQNKEKKKVMNSFLIIGLFNLALSFAFFLWFFGYFEYSSKEFVILYGIILFFQNLFFFRIIYLFSKNKKMYYFLGLYLFSIPLLFLLMASQSVFFLIFSFLFSLLLFISFTFRGDIYHKVGYAGILYSTISLILALFLSMGKGEPLVYCFISGIFLFLLLYLFLKDLRLYTILSKSKEYFEKPYFFTLISHLIFIITLTNFVFIGTIGVHEFGHFTISKFIGCNSNKIIYEGDLFRTEFLCNGNNFPGYVAMGGIFLPIILAIFLFFIGGKFVKEISYLIVGFNLLSISKDLGSLGLSNIFIFISIFAGIAFVIAGIFLIAKSKIEFEIYEKFAKENKHVP